MAPAWLHGECVSVGIIKEIEISRALGYVSPDALNRLLSCLSNYHLPTKLPHELNARDILEKMAVDKKNSGGVKRIVLLRAIGDAGNDAYPVSDDVILRVLSREIQIIPRGPITGSVVVPGSKSISNRALLMVALGNGKCAISNLLHSEDTQVMLAALKHLGVSNMKFVDNGSILEVQGVNGALKSGGSRDIYLANAGTAMRFLTTAVTLADTGRTTLTGSERMKQRPISDLVDALRYCGCSVESLRHRDPGSTACHEAMLPISVAGGGFPGGKIIISATTSSQFVSSVLLSAPYANEPVQMVLDGGVAVSRPYIDMTIGLMRKFGAVVEEPDEGVFVVSNTARYQNPSEFSVESDATSASYPMAMAAITRGRIQVTGVGSSSLQGDAKFCEILEMMGCKIALTDNTTTCDATGLEELTGVSVDMAATTDTFMTAAVLTATARKGSVSRITNIANQRVKECDRIAAMVSELSKCGVPCRELDTGIEIEGQGRDPPEQLRTHGASIACYNDHRIAMSFGVLGCLWPNIRITDKDCVDKTYPEFWDELARIGSVHGSSTGVGLTVPRVANNITIDERVTSVVLIGMRGCGKTTLGRHAAATNRLEFIDLDDVMCAKIRSQGSDRSISEYVTSHGWTAFRILESQILRETIESLKVPTVVSTGGGVVETPENLTFLHSCGLPVIWINRPFDEIHAFLNAIGTEVTGGQQSRPVYDEPVTDVWNRRKPKYASVSQYEFLTPSHTPGSSIEAHVSNVSGSFDHFLGFVSGSRQVKLRENSFFISLTYSDLLEAFYNGSLAKITADVHYVELRVDLLASRTSDFIGQQISVIRRACDLPIIFTVRSMQQGGALSAKDSELRDLILTGIRFGCELIDVESTLSENSKKIIRNNAKFSKLIGSHHVTQAPCQSTAAFDSYAKLCWDNGNVDVIKVVFSASSPKDCLVLESAKIDLASRTGISCPVIAILMGQHGRLTRVLNTFMNPVTHAMLQSKAAPGQMTAEEVLRLRSELGLVP